jgi:hypothetical protein
VAATPLKSAALNAVMIAELLLREFLDRRDS